MGFQLTCPNCGKRSVQEFAFKGEYRARPDAQAAFPEWSDYVYHRANQKGAQLEWWFHRSGCQSWFIAERDTTRNTQHQSYWFRDMLSGD
jgi:heterotetrameric sarcosine oxidase delta subunit